ncbi:MAG: tetratricopeptide repeat protein [Phycisphaerae bacterium]
MRITRLIACAILTLAAGHGLSLAEDPASEPATGPAMSPQQRTAKAAALQQDLIRLFASKDYEKAAALCRQVIDLTPKDPMGYYNLACAQARLGKNEEAMASLTKSVELGYTDISHIRADDDLAALRDRQAFKDLISAIATKELDKWSADVKNNPNNANSRYNLACALALLGRKDEAMAALAKAVDLGWDNPEHMRSDPDLAELRKDKQFDELAAKADENEKKAPYEKGKDIEGVKTVEGFPTGGLRYRLRMGPDAARDKPDRLIIWMHPSGGSANIFAEALSPMMVKKGFALLVLTRKNWMGWSGEDAVKLLNKTLPEVGKIEGIDVRRPILMGFSAGGQMALSLWADNADKFGGLIIDAAYPVSQTVEGGRLVAKPLEPPKGKDVRKTPILVVVGTEDFGAGGNAAAAKARGIKPLCEMWRKVEKPWTDAGVPLTIEYVQGAGHGWLLRPSDKANLAVLEKWLDEVAQGKLPASRPASQPASDPISAAATR